MKAYTSRELFDERRRFTGVRERMGQVRLDSEANEQVVLVRTDARRRSADVAEGSPDDGFLVTDLHLLDSIRSTEGWRVVGLPPEDERVIPPELGLVRRDPDTLPHVVRSRGHTSVVRVLPSPIDILRLPVPLHPDAATYQAGAIVLQVRFRLLPTDDELVDVRVVALDSTGGEHDVGGVVELRDDWTRVRVPLADLAPLRAGAPGAETVLLGGWGLRGLPPRAEVFFDALLAEDPGLGEGDLVIRGGDSTLAGAGRIYVSGYRAFLESDWRYLLQPDLPDPVPLARPEGQVRPHHLVYVDIWERPIHAFQDAFLRELALGGEETGFRSRKVAQVRVLEVEEGGSEELASPTGDGHLTTNILAGALPDRFPAEDPDPCRDRCLFTENLSTGEGYLGQHNVQVRVEVLLTHLARPVVGWSRENASVVAPLVVDAGAGANVVHVDPEAALRLAAGDLVIVEDERSRLDPGRDVHRHCLRRLRAVNAETGELEFEPAGTLAATDPDPLDVGGGLDRAFAVVDAAAVRRWDGADWLLTGVRYNLADGITFALGGSDFRITEYWTFTARVADPDASARGVVEQLTDAPVHGPCHQRVALARVVWTETGRELVDLRVRFLPLHEVRDRLIELGRRHLSPGAFTVVVGDGVDTFGDVDQDLEEGVTGDEALQAALDRLRVDGGTIYVRAGRYRLEHPVLLRARSRTRILGDGDASELVVTGAGGAFYLDWCGHQGDVSVELLRMVESPGEETPFGAEALVPALPVAPIAPGPEPQPLLPSDLTAAVPFLPDLLTEFAGRLRVLRPFEGRAADSVVATIARLRRLQRAEPGRPLEDVAPDELAVLRRLPHGVVTVADSSRVRLTGLTIVSREAGQAAGVVAAGVLVSGSCTDVEVSGCRIDAPSGVVAAPYGRSLTPAALVLRPRSGLFLRGLTVADNEVQGIGQATFGVRVADGVVDGLDVHGNRVDGFMWGVALEDRAESRAGEPVDRSVVRDNLVVGPRAVGILVTGDGIDVQSNEVRVGANREPFCAAIQVTGVANRVRDCWITLPAGDRPPLGLHAGIVVGSGIDRPDLLGRPVQDVEVAGNRIEGSGAFATGVLVGGSQPTYDVRVVGNTIRNLGDAGVRAWGHGGSVGGLRVEENSIEGVARGYLVWGPQAVTDLVALTGDVAVPAQAVPRDALEVLLSQATGVAPALDAVLRWLEQATLRGGVVLSLVEESEVRRNRIVDVGTRTLPAGFTSPGATIRTAGVAIAGGRDIVVQGNQVQRVLAPVQVAGGGPGPVQPLRPPIFDFLRGLGVSRRPLVGIGTDLHGAAVALRRDVVDYALGPARTRQRLGGRIYAAMEAVATALEQGGPERRRLALELTGGISEMQEAQGLDQHTRSANHVRATLSRIASLVAPDEEVSRAWAVAGGFDDSLLASEEDVVAAAADVATMAGDLSQGLEQLNLDLAGKAQEVVAAAGSATARRLARLTLAQALGMMAEGRASVVETGKAAGGSGLAPGDRAVAEGIVRLSLAALGTPDAAELNEEAVAGIEKGAGALAEVLHTAHPVLADRVRSDARILREAAGRPAPEVLSRVRETLGVVRSFAAGEEVAVVRAEDVEARQERFRAELITLTADQLERRVAGLAVDPESAATRNLRLLEQSAGQLTNLLSNRPELASKARQARRSLGSAITDVDRRAEHEAEARRLLLEVQEGQAKVAGVAVPAAPLEAEPDGAEVRLAGLGELLLTVRESDDADRRREGLSLFEEELRRAVDAVGVTGAERESLLSGVPDATAVLASDAGPEARAAALHTLAVVVETLSYRLVQRPDAQPQARAVHALSGAVVRAIDTREAEPDRLSSLARFLASNADALSSSVAGELAGAPTAIAALAAARRGLGSLVNLRPLPLPLLPFVRIDAHPADGLYVAGVQRRLEVQGNLLEDARTGGTVAGQSDHVLAPVADQPALSLAVDGNQVAGGAVGGLDLRPDGNAVVAVVGNEVTGCAGVGVSPEPEHGQAVVRVAGAGDLLVAANHLRDNGNRRSGGTLHELLLDWRGDVTVRDNLVRHAGGGAGGAGAVVLVGAVADDLVRSLSTQPALAVEPVSPPPPPLGPIVSPDLEDFVAAGLGPQKDLLAAGATFGVGSFRLATRELRPGVALFGVGADPSPPVDLPQMKADQWVDAAVIDRFDPLLGFLRRVRPPLVIFRPRARRAVHMAGNDVVAAGPALLLLVEGGDLVSATVVGNELESSAATGAAYLRNVDTTVFAANRCECLAEINVVVVRARQSLVSVMGNVAAGAQPATPPRPPFVPVRPDLGRISDVHLAVKVGEEGALTMKLDEEALLSAISEKKGTSFQSLTEDAEASFNVFARRHRIVPGPEVAKALSLAGPAALLNIRAGEGGPIFERREAPPAGRSQPPPGKAKRAQPPGADVVLEPAHPPVGDVVLEPAHPPVGDVVLEPARPPVGDAVVERAVVESNRILGDKGLSGSAKLFGLAVSSGLAPHQAKALVQTQLARTGGDETAALASGLSVITGIEDVGPTVSERVEAASPVEDIVALLLRNRHFTPVRPIEPFRPVPPRPRPPDARSHSVVILGGSRVGAVNNVTTAGVHVHDAAQAIENNL